MNKYLMYLMMVLAIGSCLTSFFYAGDYQAGDSFFYYNQTGGIAYVTNVINGYDDSHLMTVYMDTTASNDSIIYQGYCVNGTLSIPIDQKYTTNDHMLLVIGQYYTLYWGIHPTNWPSNFNLVKNQVDLYPYNLNTHIKLADLLKDNSTPLDNQSVKLIFNGNYSEKSAITDGNGTCYFDLSDIRGNRTGHLEFNGGSWLNGTNSEHIQFRYHANATRLNTSIIGSNLGVYEGDNVTFNATLIDSNNISLANKNLIASVLFDKDYNLTTDENGSISLNLINVTENKTIVFVFEGDNQYETSNATFKVSVFKRPYVQPTGSNDNLEPAGPNYNLDLIKSNHSFEPLTNSDHSLPNTGAPLVLLAFVLCLVGVLFKK